MSPRYWKNCVGSAKTLRSRRFPKTPTYLHHTRSLASDVNPSGRQTPSFGQEYPARTVRGGRETASTRNSQKTHQDTCNSLTPDLQKLARISVKSMKKTIVEPQPKIVGSVLCRRVWKELWKNCDRNSRTNYPTDRSPLCSPLHKIHARNFSAFSSCSNSPAG